MREQRKMSSVGAFSPVVVRASTRQAIVERVMVEYFCVSARRTCWLGVVLLVALFSAVPARANGPVPPPELRWVEGQLLVQVEKGVDLHRTALKTGSVTPGIDELNRQFSVVAAELVMPQYRPTTMEALRGSTKGRSMADAELELMDRLGRWVLLKADPTSDVEAMAEAYAKLDEVIVRCSHRLLGRTGGR